MSSPRLVRSSVIWSSETSGESFTFQAVGFDEVFRCSLVPTIWLFLGFLLDALSGNDFQDNSRLWFLDKKLAIEYWRPEKVSLRFRNDPNLLLNSAISLTTTSVSTAFISNNGNLSRSFCVLMPPSG